MSKKWYVLHTYSGYENKVKAALETRIETMGLENNIFGIEIPTQVVAEIKDGGKRVESEKKVFPGYVLVRILRHLFSPIWLVHLYYNKDRRKVN